MRALLFDFGGTLDADGLTWKERIAALYRHEGVAISAERFDRTFYAADDALVGAIPVSLSLRETVWRLVSGVTRGLGLPDGGVTDRVAMRFLADARACLERNAPLLGALGRRYRLGIVSNFYGNLEAVCEESGVGEFFSVIVDSARVGCRKPDPRIFTIAVDMLGVKPADALFIGDSLARDMAGARGVGMPHVWLVADASPESAPCCPDDRVIHALKEIEAALDGYSVSRMNPGALGFP